MLLMTATLFTEYAMPEFCFFKKGRHIAALERSDAEKAAQLAGDGWEKQFEEVRAADPESALARLADMRKEEVTTERAFITGSVFSSLLTAILK
nr:hypothetical protein [Streptococcus suis]